MFDLPITIIAGYLGSGKTTLINEKLSNNDGVRYAVLVNDFGDLNIDAELLDSQDGMTIALENGCVCCSLAGGMEQAAEQIRTIADQIDWVLLEASGVAEPNRLQRRVQSWPGFTLTETKTLIDATRIRKLVQDKFIGQHIQKQLHDADHLQLSKTDLISKTELLELTEWLKTQSEVETNPAKLHLPHPSFHSETIPLIEPVEKNTLERWLASLDDTTLRLKGFVRLTEEPRKLFVVQWVDQTWSIIEHRGQKTHFQPALIRITSNANRYTHLPAIC